MSIRSEHEKELKRIQEEIAERKQAVHDSVLKINKEEKRFQRELVKEANGEQKSVDDQIDRGAEKILSNVKKRGVTIKSK